MSATELVEAGLALANLLAEENRLLADSDLAGAGALNAMKRQAVERFEAARAAAANITAAGAEANTLGRLSERLADLAETNRRLLEQAMAAQARLIACIAAAARPTGPGYAPAPPLARPVAFAINAKA